MPAKCPSLEGLWTPAFQVVWKKDTEGVRYTCVQVIPDLLELTAEAGLLEQILLQSERHREKEKEKN